jgi:hypothetical protein
MGNDEQGRRRDGSRIEEGWGKDGGGMEGWSRDGRIEDE